LITSRSMIGMRRPKKRQQQQRKRNLPEFSRRLRGSGRNRNPS
jgi:hypothetical protein